MATINIEIPKPLKGTDEKSLIMAIGEIIRALEQIRQELQRLEDKKADA